MDATTKALLLGMLAIGMMAPAVSAENEPEPPARCEIVETMTFYPFVVVHPECIPSQLPPTSQG